MPKPNWDLPLPNYEPDINELKRVYRNSIAEVIAILEELSSKASVNPISRKQMNSTLAQLSVHLKKLDKEAEAWVEEQISKAFLNGQAESVLAAGKAATIEEAVKLATFSQIAMYSVEAMIADTFEDLLYANNKMKRETVKMVRSVVSEQMKTKAAQGMGRNTTRKAIIEALTKKDIRKRFDLEGNVAIIDKLGRKWKLETYSEMVTRTKMLQAHVEGTRVEAMERDIDLAIISSHGASDACSSFEGQVISMNGTTDGYHSYESLRSSNLIFHPNCRHKITPLRDLDLLPDKVRQRFEDGRDAADESFKRGRRKK